MKDQNKDSERYYFDRAKFVKQVLRNIDECFPNLESHNVGTILKEDPTLQIKIVDFINDFTQEVEKKKSKNFLTVVK